MTLLKNRIYFFVILIMIILIFFVIILFSLKINNTINAVLEVDANKDMEINFPTSNINLISGKKDIAILIESKYYNIKDISFINQGNNTYKIKFYDDNIYDIVKTKSVYSIKIFLGSKNLFEYMFNI